MRGSRAFPALLALAFVAAGLSAQPSSFHLASSRLGVAEPFSIALSGGPPGAVYHVGMDSSPGPVTIPGLGSVALGFSPAVYFVLWLQLDPQGAGGFTASVHSEPSYAGNMVHAQAGCADPTSPTGSRLSNPVARGFHPTTPLPSMTQTLPMGEDTSLVVFLPFGSPFPFYGGNYTQLGVSANGLITFGGTSTDPTEQVSDLVAGHGKIAALWDDLSPQVAGEVAYRSGPGFVQFCWRGVPQFYILDSNWATATLWQNGVISLEWLTVDLYDSMVGLSPGHGLGTAVATDFSMAACQGTSSGGGAVYQQFSPAVGTFDLEHQRITFFPQPGGGYRWVR